MVALIYFFPAHNSISPTCIPTTTSRSPMWTASTLDTNLNVTTASLPQPDMAHPLHSHTLPTTKILDCSQLQGDIIPPQPFLSHMNPSHEPIWPTCNPSTTLCGVHEPLPHPYMVNLCSSYGPIWLTCTPSHNRIWPTCSSLTALYDPLIRRPQLFMAHLFPSHSPIWPTSKGLGNQRTSIPLDTLMFTMCLQICKY